VALPAQMAELVDALVSGTSGESRGGSSPLLGTIYPRDPSPWPGLRVGARGPKNDLRADS
jgi:hypothetical protein